MAVALEEKGLFTPGDFARLRRHPSFRQAVRRYAEQNLALYGRLDVIERWLVSDLGRWSLTSAAVVLDSLPGGLTQAKLSAAAAANRTCSEGRVRAYLRRARANGLVAAAVESPRLRLMPRLTSVIGRFASNLLAAVGALAPQVAAAADRVFEEDFRRRFYAAMGVHTSSRPDLFAGPDMPVMLFLARDGGTRMLEHLVARQPAGAQPLLGAAAVSQSALARASHVSRTHVARLLADGVEAGLLDVDGRRVTATPALAEDVERHYALVMEMARVCALAALRG